MAGRESDAGRPTADEGAGEGAHVGAVKTILGLGEEKMGEVVNQLLANEGFVLAVQKAISGGLQAKRSLDKNVARVLSMVNVPTLEDVDQVRDKLRELEDALVEIGERVRAIDGKIDEKLLAAREGGVAGKKEPGASRKGAKK